MITKYKKAALDRLQGRWWTEIGYISIYFCIILLSEILIDETRFIFKLIVSIIANVIYLGYTKHVLVFLLSLSFIGWILLGIITIVGVIPVIVYMTFSMIEQYKYLSIRSEV